MTTTTETPADTAALASDPTAAAEQAAGRITELTGVTRHDVALVMGSGWGPAADALGTPTHDLAFTDVPGFAPSAVAGHAGRILSVPVGDRRALVFLGRTHLYEGRGTDAVAHGVRTAVASGCHTVVLTNSCGGLRTDMRPGQPALISDHINMTAATPLHGAHFVDLTDLYSHRLRELCRRIDPTLTEGVYAQWPGPQYETPAEIRMLRTLGADLVGMSTALEAIAARAAGAEVLGLSLVTNLAAGMSGEPLDHAEVLRTGRDSASRMGELLTQLLTEM
ncbi:purine-nucleoside phosphorylase [Streptomyces colonosanans]|uniref:Purine nucleoside phosphorylase n=1 Tax=Streptomyces colonosanans TaxID=1428652 RepID=A0A1S2PGH7_9ACTN|nr:purine-nucleoside phosphorylase [Streptomyces colonosanans]OIJ92716.1 purine-nucleoside phosphorylase [Streptomyces colonosanans]